MRNMILAVVLTLFLTGCGSGAAWEQVMDIEPPDGAVCVWQEDAYALQIGIPDKLQLMHTGQGTQLYETPEGDWWVQTQTFLASDLNTAVRQLSGFDADRLTILQTTRFGLPQYRFVWCSQTAEGARLCRAELVMDGMVCYAVVSSTAESAGDRYASQIRQVFSSFGLSDGEMV